MKCVMAENDELVYKIPMHILALQIRSRVHAHHFLCWKYISDAANYCTMQDNTFILQVQHSEKCDLQCKGIVHAKFKCDIF